jgi:hypothetical protein
MAVAAVAEFRQLTSPPVEQPSTSPPVCRLPASPLAAWPFATSWPWASWQRISLPWISRRTTWRGLTSRPLTSLQWTSPALVCAGQASPAVPTRIVRGPAVPSRVLRAPGPPNNRINFEIVCTGLSAPHHEFTTSLRKSLPSHRHPRYSERTTMRCLDNTDTLRRR